MGQTLKSGLNRCGLILLIMSHANEQHMIIYHITSVPKECILREICLSPEGTHVAIITSINDRFSVLNADGTRSDYDHARALAIGPNGNSTVCLAQSQGQIFVPVNGLSTQRYDWAMEPVLSPNGRSHAYWAMRRNRSSITSKMDGYLMVCDSLEFGPYEELGHIGFSSQSNTLFYSIQNRGSSYVVQGGRHGPIFDLVTQPVVNPADGSIWYWGQRSDKWHLMKFDTDTLVVKSSTLPYEPGPFFSPDGLSFACWFCEGDRWSILINGDRVAALGSPIDGSSEISIFSSWNYSYSFIHEHKVFVIDRGETSGPMDAVGRTRFSQDGSRVGYLARVGERGFAVVDGKRSDEFDVVADDVDYETPNSCEHTVVFNDDGSCFAYPARCGEANCIVLNNEPGRPFYALSGMPAFNPSSNHLVYGCIDDGKEYVDIHGNRGEPYDRVWSPMVPISGKSVLWSPTSNRFSLCATVNNNVYKIKI